MFKLLRRKEKLSLGILSLIMSLFLFLWGNNATFLGASIGIKNFTPIPYVSLVIFAVGFFLIMTRQKSLEAIMVPTGSGGKIDEQRALVGAKVYHEHPDSLVIISGIVKGKFLGSQSAGIYKTLRRAGVPRGHIEIEGKSKDTLENVRCASKILTDEGVQRLYVATDKDHARRIGMLFQTAKSEGLVPESLKVRPYSKGIDKAYSPANAQAHYAKDLLLSVKTGKPKGL